MGRDRVRHLVHRKGRFYWLPSKTLESLGFSPEPLGSDPVTASQRASYLNGEADKARVANKAIEGPVLAASAVCRLIPLYKEEAWENLKPRTQEDYAYWLEKIEHKWGKYQVELFDRDVIGVWLKSVSQQPKGEYKAYHMGLMLRTFLKWCAPKYIPECPEFVVRTPKARKSMWMEPEIWAVVAVLKAEGFQSLAVGMLIEWCIGQNPGDVWALKCSSYKNGAIDVTRSKTGVGGAPIPLWDDVRGELDDYLRQSPAVGEAPLLRNERTKSSWVESTRAKTFARARHNSAVRPTLQLRDLRRTAITEAINAGSTRDQIRSLSRHATNQGLEPYVEAFNSVSVADVQARRLSARTSINKPPKKTE